MTDLDRIRDRIASIQKVKIPAIYNRAAGIVATFFSVFLFVFAGVFTGAAGIFVIADLYLIFFPFLWFAQIEKWYPAIRNKIAVFDPLLEAELPEEVRLEPTLFFAGSGEQVPSDMRLMLAPVSQKVRDELLGAQFQVTYNNGPNGAVPYMYVVFITRGLGKIWQSLKNTSAPRYVTESGSSPEGDTAEGATSYGTVVLRLDTKSRADGYHTRESDVKELLHLAVQTLRKFL